MRGGCAFARKVQDQRCGGKSQTVPGAGRVSKHTQLPRASGDRRKKPNGVKESGRESGRERYESTNRQERNPGGIPEGERFPVWSLWAVKRKEEMLRVGWTGKSESEENSGGFGVVWARRPVS